MDTHTISAADWQAFMIRYPAAHTFLVGASLRGELNRLRRAQERHSENALAVDWTAWKSARLAELEVWAAGTLPVRA